jgi:hypothetical protein
LWWNELNTVQHLDLFFTLFDHLFVDCDVVAGVELVFSEPKKDLVESHRMLPADITEIGFIERWPIADQHDLLSPVAILESL